MTGHLLHRTCTLSDCGAKHYSLGYCQKHYDRMKRNGTTEKLPRPSASQRFWTKVEKSSDGCWLWTGARSTGGYGRFYDDGFNHQAHRFAYEAANGPVSLGLELDHLCRNRACVNPDHLEPVTPHENWRRGNSRPAENARKTHCKRGHEFTPENTRQRPGRGGRVCLACEHAYEKARWAASREAS